MNNDYQAGTAPQMGYAETTRDQITAAVQTALTQMTNVKKVGGMTPEEFVNKLHSEIQALHKAHAHRVSELEEQIDKLHKKIGELVMKKGV